jgi:hypothetical protein
LKPQKLFDPPRPKLLKMLAPSMKKGRFSSKNVSNAVRFTTAGSTSTCPKSGLMLPSSERLLLIRYFRSTPAPANARAPSLKGSPGAGSTYSARLTTYGTSSTVRCGVTPSSPWRCPILDARPLSVFGTCTSQASSFFRWM